MTVLILAEHDGSHLHPATARAVSAASQLGDSIIVLVAAGSKAQAIAAEASALQGVSEVRVAEAEHYQHMLAEEIAPLLVREAKEAGADYLLAAATTTGKDILPRASALLGVQQISEVIEIVDATTFKRPIYAGNAIETVQAGEGLKVMTLRHTSFDAAPHGGSANVVSVEATPAVGLSRFVEDISSGSDRPDLSSARVVISGGRGLGSKENFELLETLASKLNAAIGASRAAVDAGYAPNDWQVGQTGKIVAPELYIAVGISGAIQHVAGIKDSKVIVAINKDENAPIFELADYGLVADLFVVLPELIEALDR